MNDYSPLLPPIRGGRGQGRRREQQHLQTAKLTAERKTLNRRYLALKEEVKEAEQIRKSVYNILRQEQREQQPRRAQDMER